MRAFPQGSRPLRDLTVVVGGEQVTTGEGGPFAGGVASLPAGQTAHVLPFEHFWSSTVLGRFDKLE